MKRTILIIGTGVLGAYLTNEFIKKKYKIIVTTRHLKKNYKNYQFLKIQNKVKFVKLDVLDKKKIFDCVDRYKPKSIFYFSGQSSIVKSIELRKQTYQSIYIGAKNFIKVLKKFKDIKFLKSNSGYIFKSTKGEITLKSKFSRNNNPYIQSQLKSYKMIQKERKKGLKLYNLVFFQVESPLRPNDFFVKKVCLHAQKKKKIVVGNINSERDFSWAPEIIKAIYFTSLLSPRDIIISSGYKMSGKKVIFLAYNYKKLDYKNYVYQNKKFFRKNEIQKLVGSRSNHKILSDKFNWKPRIFGKKLIEKMMESV